MGYTTRPAPGNTASASPRSPTWPAPFAESQVTGPLLRAIDGGRLPVERLRADDQLRRFVIAELCSFTRRRAAARALSIDMADVQGGDRAAVRAGGRSVTACSRRLPEALAVRAGPVLRPRSLTFDRYLPSHQNVPSFHARFENPPHGCQHADCVLLFNLGGPDDLAAIRARAIDLPLGIMSAVRAGAAPSSSSRLQGPASGAALRLVGGGSPQLGLTRDQPPGCSGSTRCGQPPSRSSSRCATAPVVRRRAARDRRRRHPRIVTRRSSLPKATTGSSERAS